MSLVLSLFIALISGNVFADVANPLRFPSNGIKSLSVSVPKGKIVLVSSKTQKDISVDVVEQNSKENSKCIKTIGLENTQLNVKITSENIIFEKADCNYDVTVTVPISQNFDMNISSGTAAVTVKDISGALDVKTATGSVGVSGDVLRNISAKTATGAMSFAYKTCSGRADLDLMSATGKMTLSLPPTCKIRVDYKSATGKLFNAIGETEEYQVFINGKSASGDLSIVKI